MTDQVLVTDDGAVRTIRMNRPDKKNALTFAVYEAMTDALDSANGNDAVRCVMIAGVPGAFTAGNDLADFLKAAQAAVPTPDSEGVVELVRLPANVVVVRAPRMY